MLRVAHKAATSVPRRTEAGPTPATAQGPPMLRAGGFWGEKRGSGLSVHRTREPQLAGCMLARSSWPWARARYARGATLPAAALNNGRPRELLDKPLEPPAMEGT